MKNKFIVTFISNLCLCFISIIHAQNCDFLCNKDFEDVQVVAAGGQTVISQTQVPCWNTTASDGMIEVWGSGFNGVPSYSGNQFIELNANMVSTLYQNFTAGLGTNVTIGFAHRGRLGVDSMSVSIGPVGGPYSTLGTFGDGNTAWVYRTLNYTIPNMGNYTLRFNSVYATGGSLSVGNFLDFIQITINPMPTANAGSDLNIGACPWAADANMNGSGTGSAPLVYSWLPTAGLSDPNIANPVAHPSVTTTYTLQVTDANGCYVSDSVLITVDPLPTANAGIDISICNGSTVQLIGSGTGTSPLSYSWLPTTGLSDPNIPGPLATPTDTTFYQLTVTDSYGCAAIDSVLITFKINPTITISASANPICIGDTTILTASGAISYIWNPGGIATNPLVVTPNNTTTYTVTGTDSFGCTGEATATIVVDAIPIIDFIANPWENVIDEPINFTGTSNVPINQWNWDFGDLTTDNSGSNVSHAYSQDGEYIVTLTVSSDHGCVATISHSVIIELNLQFPNIFTPNKDGHNDTFEIFGLKPGRENKLQVFNRWGKKIYEKESYDNSWTGDDAADGTYYFVFTWKSYSLNEDISYSGTVIILR